MREGRREGGGREGRREKEREGERERGSEGARERGRVGGGGGRERERESGRGREGERGAEPPGLLPAPVVRPETDWDARVCVRERVHASVCVCS